MDTHELPSLTGPLNEKNYTTKAPLRPVPLNRLNTLTPNCQHYAHWEEVPRHLRKYWEQRHDIFSQYDEGIVLTDDAWFGVTPEPVADAIAETLAKSNSSRTTIVDLFAGVGGNVIAFARATPDRWEKIIAIEQDEETLICARHNAEIYGVGDIITWVHGNSLDFLDLQYGDAQRKLDAQLRLSIENTVLFASPPWGGPGYRADDIFDLTLMEPYNLETLEYFCQDMPHALYLPRTSDIRQIAQLAGKGRKIKITQYCVHGASKALVAYIPHRASLEAQEAAGGAPARDGERGQDPFFSFDSTSAPPANDER